MGAGLWHTPRPGQGCRARSIAFAGAAALAVSCRLFIDPNARDRRAPLHARRSWPQPHAAHGDDHTLCSQSSSLAAAIPTSRASVGPGGAVISWANTGLPQCCRDACHYARPLRDGGISFEAADLAWPVRVSPLLRREGVFGSDAIDERELSYDDDDDASASGQYQTGTSSSGQRPFLLRGISLAAARGELVAVVGAVGAGKTALLSALTGDMDTVRGMVHVRGSIAYAAQRPFLLSASVRENILFGLPYDEARYVRVIKACALASEVADMPAGDLTIVGERGLSLSGGQRARVALARAAYSDAQVVLLDDPLAAVDGAVARHLMAECIGPGGLLSDRLVIMATNQLELLRAARRIVLLRQGEIVEEGSYETLSTAEDGEFAKLLALQRHSTANQRQATV